MLFLVLGIAFYGDSTKARNWVNCLLQKYLGLLVKKECVVLVLLCWTWLFLDLVVF